VDVKQLSHFTAFSADKLKKHGLFQTPRFFLDVYCLGPGQAQTPHAHASSDKVYLVLEGRCRVTVGDEVQEVGPEGAVLCPAGVRHGIENSGAEGARVLVMMTPPPESKG
jgi:quercetin dioxygenase-like cupin family protein